MPDPDVFTPPPDADEQTIKALDSLYSWWQAACLLEDLDPRWTDGKAAAVRAAEEIHATASA